MSSSNELEQALAQKQRELDLFLLISQLGEHRLTSDKIMDFFVSCTCSFVDVPLGHYYWVAEDKEHTLIPSQRWFDKNNVYSNFIETMNNKEFDIQNDCFITNIANHGKSDWLNKISKNVFYQKHIPSDCLIKSAFAIPVFRNKEVLAVVEYFFDELTNENSQLINLLEAAASQVAVVLERRRSQKELEQKLQEIEEAYQKLKSTQLQLAESSKLASIGELAAGVAHEINNPVAFVSSNLDTLKKYSISIENILKEIIQNQKILETHPNIKSMIEKNTIEFILEDLPQLFTESKDGIERIKEIVIGLKYFARDNNSQKEDVDINECIRSTIKVLRNEYKYHCTVIKELDEIPNIFGYTGKINQVIMNIVSNAIHAIPRETQGTITITTYHDKKMVHIEITDNGSGIKEENIPNLFTPFFTTKRAGEGTGLGLSIAFKIIEEHNGAINVRSKLGEGTTFHIELPHASNT